MDVLSTLITTYGLAGAGYLLAAASMFLVYLILKMYSKTTKEQRDDFIKLLETKNGQTAKIAEERVGGNF